MERQRQLNKYWNIEIANFFQRHIDILRREAEIGETGAARELYELAHAAVKALSEVCTNHSEVVKPLSTKLSTWPVLYSPKAFGRKIANSVCEAIQLGSSAERLAQNALIAPNLPKFLVIAAVNYVHQLQDHHQERKYRAEHRDIFKKADVPIKYPMPEASTRFRSKSFEEKCLALPELTKSTFELWLPVIKEYVRLDNFGHPEDNKALEGLGRFRADAQAVEPGDPEYKKFVWEGISHKLREALKGFVGAESTLAKSSSR